MGFEKASEARCDYCDNIIPIPEEETHTPIQAFGAKVIKVFSFDGNEEIAWLCDTCARDWDNHMKKFARMKSETQSQEEEPVSHEQVQESETEVQGLA